MGPTHNFEIMSKSPKMHTCGDVYGIMESHHDVVTTSCSRGQVARDIDHPHSDVLYYNRVYYK